MVFRQGRPGARHPIEIRFGDPIEPGGDPHEVMERVRLFLAESGARTQTVRAGAPAQQPA
jgi:hypothetical protein